MTNRLLHVFAAALVASFIGGAYDAHALRGVTSSSVDLTAPGPIGSGTPSSGAFTTLSASSTVSGAGFSTYLASPPAIGGTVAAAGAFTTLTTNNLFTLTGVEDSLTAFATGGQVSATALSATKNFHRVTTVATAADSVKLPAATVGQMHYVRNDGANAMQVFGAGTDTINGVATGTGISQAAGTGMWYTSVASGAWTSSFNSTAPGAIGATTPATGSFTNVNVTGNACPTNGLYLSSSNVPAVCANSAVVAVWSGAGGFQQGSSQSLGWTSGAANAGTLDTVLARDAADTLAQKRGTNAQVSRLYFSTTGPIYWQQTARTAGALYTATGGAAQVSYAQTTVPTVTTNGGTSPACVGTDTAMTCTEGTSPPAAATFTVTFNGTWPAAPSCVALRGTAGASPLVQNVVTTTTTVQVNLSANLVASEKYHIHCYGVS
jgi:hypothetical protein